MPRGKEKEEGRFSFRQRERKRRISATDAPSAWCVTITVHRKKKKKAFDNLQTEEGGRGKKTSRVDGKRYSSKKKEKERRQTPSRPRYIDFFFFI